VAEGRVVAPFGRRVATVLGRETYGPYMVLRCCDPAGPVPAAGQFYMLAAAQRWGGGDDERPYLPRAFSVMRAAPRDARGDVELSFLLQDVGPGTERLCELGRDAELAILGPLGQGFRSPRDGRRPVLTGGGVGIAPLAMWQDALGGQATTLLGFRDRAHATGAALFDSAQVATDDGSVGHRGLITELLEAELDEEPHSEVYACGPPPMLEAVRRLCAERDVPGQLALESGMACGFGACFGCVVATTAGFVRVCVDGPVLEAAALESVTAGHGALLGAPR
jgi:dihydroorotate dehydrogenase electron transfer subunit